MKKTTIKDSLGFQLQQVSLRMMRDLQQELAAFGITAPQWNVLAALAQEKLANPSAVAEFLQADGAAVSRLLDALERKELVKRSMDPADRRAVLVELTASGQALIPKLAEIAHAIDRRYRDKLSGDDLEHLQQLLRRLAGEVMVQKHTAEDWELS